jgi:asparagine synthase (glutamine-hydrolysing)
LPGHRLTLDDGACRVEPYWSYPVPEPDRTLTESEHGERLLEVLEESVRMSLMADVPVGAMLSGGLDSSLIVALMARNSSRPVHTFAVGFERAGPTNELEDARLVAERFGTDHRELELELADDAISLEDLLWTLDEPVADFSALGFHAISKIASRHVTVALSGQGADELLGGYRKHTVAAAAERWEQLPASIRRAGAFAARHARGELRRAGAMLEPRTPAGRIVAMNSLLDPGRRRLLFTGPLAGHAEEECEAVVAPMLRRLPRDRDVLSETLFVDAQLGLVDDMLHYFDRTSMAHSLEVRVPFLDHEFVEVCATIPPELKVRGRTTKYLLKQAARGLLPEQIIDKPKIGFFHGGGPSTLGWWLEAHAGRSLARYLLDPGARTAELLDRDTVRRLVASHSRGGRRATRFMLALLMLEVWLATYVPRATTHRLAEPSATFRVPA